MGQDNAELIAEAREWAFVNAVADRPEADVLRRLADALERVTPRVVTEVAELDALPADSVIRSEQGGTWYREISGPGAVWREPGTSRKSWNDDISLPATVLFTPTGKETEAAESAL